MRKNAQLEKNHSDDIWHMDMHGKSRQRAMPRFLTLAMSEMRKQEHTYIKGLASLQSSSQLGIQFFSGIQPGTQCKITPPAWRQNLEVSQSKNILCFIVKTHCAEKLCNSVVQRIEI